MATKATKTTPHYALSQWEAEDHILRSDFNSDFSIIDSALHTHDEQIARAATSAKLTVVEEKISLLRLFHKALSADTNSLTIDLSGVNLAEYLRLQLCFTGAKITSTQTQNLYLYINGQRSSGDYGEYRSTVTDDADHLTVAYLPNYNRAYWEIDLLDSGNNLISMTKGRATDEGALSLYSTYEGVWRGGRIADVSTLLLQPTGGALSAGMEITLYGWKK